MSESTSFVRLFVGFLLSVTGVYASCPIDLNPPSVVVKYGESVTVNCSTSEILFRGMGWEASHGGTSIQKVKHVVWTVENLKEWGITPSCFINPSQESDFKQCFKHPKVVLYTFPENISISSSSGPSGPMIEGEENKFTCDIPNIAPVQNLSVKWYKGDAMVFMDTFNNLSKAPVDESSVFNFIPTRQDNGVTIRCEAHLDLSPEGPQLNVSSLGYEVEVYFGPDVQCSGALLDKLELLEGETLKGRCSVTGNPDPFVVWQKDGQPVDPALPLSRKNAGLYAIEAEGAGLVKKKMQVLVLYGPELRCQNDYTVLEDTPYSLNCTVEGYPKPEIMWTKDGEEVELPEKLTRRDSGQYLITASSGSSSVSQTVNINVIYPPSQIFELEDSEVDIGSDVWLKCSSMGNPRPKYSWDYYQTANVIQEDEDGVSRLLIHSATIYNMGFYTCHAWNDKGNVSKTVRVTVKGVSSECPVEITPDRMVVQYEDRGQHATCKPTSTDTEHAKEIYWQLSQGVRTNSTRWFVDADKDWDPRPVCIATFHIRGTCQKHLNFTLYKTPDSVSIRHVDNLSSVVEGREFQLQCDIINVAPAQNLIVRWYQGNETFQPLLKGSMRVTGCQPENDTNCDIAVIRSPLNVSSTISITLDRNQTGAKFRCEAELNLGPEGPQPPPTVMSSPLNVTVYYKPSINIAKLPKRVPVFKGYPEELVCEADGHPPPKILWLYSPDKVPRMSGNTLIVSEAGIYNCSVANEVDSTSHEVEVILKEDYLPLIAGFVALTVVSISVVFLFIYSIYYKNTKMRRYSLKNPKLDTPSGNVAHNGWDMQFPMTKLSYVTVTESSGTPQPARKPVSSSCPIKMTPPRVVVRFGDGFSVNCSSSSNRSTSVGWEAAYGQGRGLRPKASSTVLAIDSVIGWSFIPQCFINLLDGYQCSENLPVTVYKTPDDVSMSHPSQMDPMLEGETYRMQCDIINVAPVKNLTVYWHKGNKTIYTDRFQESSLSPLNKSSIFNLTAERGDNGTQIWCEVKLDFSPSVPNLPTVQSKPHDVIVLYPPTFTKPGNETMELSSGGKIILDCTATGNPMPVYKWSLAHPIQTKTNQNENQPILTPSIELPGNYSCTASNTQGKSTKYFTVVQAKRDRTTFAVLVGVLASLGVLLLISGPFFVTQYGTFSFSKGSYLKGQPTSSGPTSVMSLKGLGAWSILHAQLVDFVLMLGHCSFKNVGPFCPNIVPCRVAKLVQVGIFSLSPANRRLGAESNMENNFLKWILTLCTFYSVSAEGCSLILKPSRVVVGFGEPVSVSCEAARPVRVLGWESAISASHTQQDLSVQWKVDSLIDWIEEPICYGVFFTAPRQCEEKLNLVLYKTPDSVSIRPVNHTGPMVEGKEYQLLCEVQNIAPVQYLTLRWYKEQTEVYNHSFSDLTSPSPVQVSSILMVTPTKAENGAQYRCVAELELGPEGPQPAPTVTSEPLNASVYFPPTFPSPEPEVLELIDGAEMSLNCTATGNPTPLYSWQSSNPIQERMEDEAVLTSSSLLPGTYTCTASNTLEKRSKQFILKAKTKGV
ncbi:hemicentin-2-like [Plectropomus leopardus]|uniref:hemicentin-2-like n=1 Tax=Plectropomus leopardus TaxID=160734 RepID=UPI001C4CE211|nr:hemicentin-2-like [Plectropomus leopardus]